MDNKSSKELWTPSKEKTVWFAQLVHFNEVESQLNKLEEEEYYGININVLDTNVFITARKTTKES